MNDDTIWKLCVLCTDMAAWSRGLDGTVNCQSSFVIGRMMLIVTRSRVDCRSVELKR